MGQVSTEAAGYVRNEFRSMLEQRDIPFILHINNVVREVTSKPFQENKRLTASQLDRMAARITSYNIPMHVSRNIIIYGQPSTGTMTREDGKTFSENSIALRAVNYYFERRRVAAFDYTIGIDVSTHALCRLYEREGIRENLFWHVFAESIGAAAFASGVSLILPVGAAFALPFANGIALGRIVKDVSQSITCKIASTRTGIDVGENEINTIFNLPDRDAISFRVSTYLDYDALNTDQEKLLRQFNAVKAAHSVEFEQLMHATLIPPQINNMKHLEIKKLLLAIRSIADSPAWNIAVDGAI